MLYKQIFTILGFLWLLWVITTRYSPGWTTSDWAYVGFISLSVLLSGYSLIKDK